MGSILAGTRCSLLKLGGNRFIHVEIINIFFKSKMAASSILNFQNFAFLMKFSNFCYAKVCAVQISAKSSIHAEVINILVNPRWRPAAILDFQNFAFLIKFSNFCYAKVYAVQISAKKLNPCGSY